MYTDDLISREELNAKIGGMRKEIERLENELHLIELNITKSNQLEDLIKGTFSTLEKPLILLLAHFTLPVGPTRPWGPCPPWGPVGPTLQAWLKGSTSSAGLIVPTMSA